MATEETKQFFKRNTIVNSRTSGKNHTTGYSQVRWEMIWRFALCVVPTSVLLQVDCMIFADVKWYIKTHSFAALRTLSLGLNSKQALSWFCFAHIKQQISYSPPEATLKLELHRVQNARSFPNELDCNQYILGEYCSDLALNNICFWHFITMSRSTKRRWNSGPSTPSSTSKKKKYNYKFQDEWKKSHHWLQSSSLGNDLIRSIT
jgi:hypothetical protein